MHWKEHPTDDNIDQEVSEKFKSTIDDIEFTLGYIQGVIGAPPWRSTDDYLDRATELLELMKTWIQQDDMEMVASENGGSAKTRTRINALLQTALDFEDERSESRSVEDWSRI